jgi:hypothetical protein
VEGQNIRIGDGAERSLIIQADIRQKIFKSTFFIPDWDTNFQMTIPPELHNLVQTDVIFVAMRDGAGNDVVVYVNVTPMAS